MIFGQTWTLQLSAPMLLAVVATLGYLVGGRRMGTGAKNRANNRHEILRALAVARELESITQRLQRSLTSHVPAVVKFSARLKRMERSPDLSWHELCDRADELLKPALRLSTEVSHAYAEILQQMTHLSTFAELRLDPLTAVCNRRAFDDSLESFIVQQSRDGVPFSVAMMDIDFFKKVNDEQGHLHGDRVLQDLAGLLKANMRERDVLARYGGEEFVILMPATELSAACNICERLRAEVETSLPITISMGLAVSMPEDATSSLLSRADAALYLAKGAGRNCVYFHEGPPGRIVGIRVATPAQAAARDGRKVPRAAGMPLAILAESMEPAPGPQFHSEAG